MLRVLAIGHILIGALLLPLSIAGGLLAPILMIGPIWGVILGVRLWKPRPGVYATVTRTHYAYLLIDALLIWYGIYAIRAAERSAAQGGGLLGGFGFIPLALGIMMAVFSLLTLSASRQLRALSGTPGLPSSADPTTPRD